VGKADPSKRRTRRRTLYGLAGAAILLYGGAVLVNVPRAARGMPSLPDLSALPSASRSDALLGRVVSALAQRSALVQCWSHADWRTRVAEFARHWPRQPRLGPWAAYTSYRPVLAVNVSPEVCIELTRLARAPGPVRLAGSPVALAKSLEVIAHESAHVAGFLNEAAAECYGMQSIRNAAVELGRTARDGHYLAELYWKRWYRWNRPEYRSSECRNGGALDLRPQSADWP
jgi:hypothetical protein